MKINKIKFLKDITKPYKKLIIISFLLILFINLIELAKPYIIKLVIDNFLVNRIEETKFNSIVFMGEIYFVIAIIGAILIYIQENSINKIGQNIIFDLRNKIFTCIQNFDFKFHDNYRSGSLYSRIMNDVEDISSFFTEILLPTLKNIFLLVGILITMFILNVKLTLISLTILPLIITITYIYRRKVYKYKVESKKITSKIIGLFAENIAGMKFIQTFGIQERKHEELKEHNQELKKVRNSITYRNPILKPLIEIIQNIGISLLIIYSVNSKSFVDIGIIYVFITYIRNFWEPINSIIESSDVIQEAFVAIDRIFDVLQKQDTNLENLESGLNIQHFEGKIEFENVWFAYKDSEWVLKNISFTIEAKEVVAFVGKTGSGKSTIISLINKFYTIQKGNIYIDGINIDDINLVSLRKNIATILQNPFIFAKSIKENIVLYDKNITEENIDDAVKASNCEELLKKLPSGINTIARKEGVTFSAGEKQLLELARAIAHNSSIFILDEATASIDTKTEKEIQSAINKLYKTKTVIIIAHRLSTIRNADKIIVIEKGEISEQGNHDKLMKNKQKYYEMINVTKKHTV